MREITDLNLLNALQATLIKQNDSQFYTALALPITDGTVGSASQMQLAINKTHDAMFLSWKITCCIINGISIIHTSHTRNSINTIIKGKKRLYNYST